MGWFGTWRVRRRLRQGPDRAAALGPKAAAELIRALDEPAWRKPATRALVRLGAPCRPVLLRALARKGAPVRRILEVLGRLRPKADPGPMLPYLRVADAKVRRVAARAVSEQGGLQAHKAMAALLVDGDEPVRQIAARHFTRSTDPRSVRPLAMTVAYGDESGARFAARRIAALGPLAVAPLLDALRTHDGPLRKAIGRLLDDLNDPDSLVILCKGLEEDDPRIWGPVRDALGRKPTLALPYLLPLANHPDERVRELAGTLTGAPESKGELNRPYMPA